MIDLLSSIGYIVIMKILKSIARAIEKSGKSCYQISKETKVDQAVLSRIVNGGSCSIETADTLFKYFGLTIAKKKRSQTKRRRPP